MTLATTPTTSTTATPRFGEIADRRWRDWRGPVAVWAAGRPINATAIQREWRDWLLHLLSLGIPLRVIRRSALDDPREPRLVLQARAELYLERKGKRNGHIEGTRLEQTAGRS